MNYLIAAYEGLYNLWKEYSPEAPETQKMEASVEAARTARETGIEMSDEEKADYHMRTGNEFMANKMKEAAVEFRNAKTLYTKLGMTDKAKEANMAFRKARRIR